jgi:hypothetical protein
MARRSKPAELAIQVSFEATRIGLQCLAEAYEQLVPIPRRLARPTEHHGVPPGLPVVAGRADWRRADHG